MSRIIAQTLATASLATSIGLAQSDELGAPSDATLPDCPAQLRVLNEPPGEPFECLCTPEIRRQRGTEKIYGSGPYDSISNICIAAVHAGVTGREGGPVRVIPGPPQSSFEGTLANGVYSADWGVSLFNTIDVEPLE